MTFQNPSNDTIKKLLTDSKTIAIVGLSNKPYRDSNKIANYLLSQGFKIIPVNPVLDEVLGLKSYPNLSAIPEKIDIVDVFRKSEAVAEIAKETIKIGAKTLWLQLGVIDHQAAIHTKNQGIEVIMDRCILVEHRKLI